MSPFTSSFRYFSTRKQLAIITSCLVLWLLLDGIIDHFLVRRIFPRLADILLLTFKLKIPAQEFPGLEFSAATLIGIPLLILALVLIPWRNLKSISALKSAFMTWCLPVFCLLAIPFLATIGQAFYNALEKHLPEALVGFCKDFSLEISVRTSLIHDPYKLTCTLAGVIGLAVGAYLLLREIAEISK